MNNVLVALVISMIANFILVAVNNYLLYVILIRFKTFILNDEKRNRGLK